MLGQTYSADAMAAMLEAARLPGNATPFRVLFGGDVRTQIDAVLPELDGSDLQGGGMHIFVADSKDAWVKVQEAPDALQRRHELQQHRRVLCKPMSEACQRRHVLSRATWCWLEKLTGLYGMRTFTASWSTNSVRGADGGTLFRLRARACTAAAAIVAAANAMTASDVATAVAGSDAGAAVAGTDVDNLCSSSNRHLHRRDYVRAGTPPSLRLESNATDRACALRDIPVRTVVWPNFADLKGRLSRYQTSWKA